MPVNERRIEYTRRSCWKSVASEPAKVPSSEEAADVGRVGAAKKAVDPAAAEEAEAVAATAAEAAAAAAVAAAVALRSGMGPAAVAVAGAVALVVVLPCVRDCALLFRTSAVVSLLALRGQ